VNTFSAIEPKTNKIFGLYNYGLFFAFLLPINAKLFKYLT
jgi:hypothetical protein